MVDALELWEAKEVKEMEIEDNENDPIVIIQLNQEFSLYRGFGIDFDFTGLSDMDKAVINTCCRNMNGQRYLILDGNGILNWYLFTHNRRIKDVRFSISIGLFGEEKESLEFEFETPEYTVSLDNYRALSVCGGWVRGVEPMISLYENSYVFIFVFSECKNCLFLGFICIYFLVNRNDEFGYLIRWKSDYSGSDGLWVNSLEFALSFGDRTWIGELVRHRDRLIDAAIPFADNNNYYSSDRITTDFNTIIEILLNK